MISIYPNTFSKDFSIVSPEKIMQFIIEGEWSQSIAYLQSLNKSEYDAEKKKLPAVTWSGVFKPGTRKIETIERYSGLVVLDIDKLDQSVISNLKRQMFEDLLIHFCFVSPSGNGLKVVVKVNTGPEHHRAAFLHLQKVFEEKYLIKVDPSGKDICRLCYVSFDLHAIVNLNSHVFEVDTRYGEVITEHVQRFESAKTTDDHRKILSVCIKWVDKNKSYRDGEKNIYIHALACALNRCGVPQDSAIQLIEETLPTPDKKWYQSVRSAYFHNQHEHGKVQVKEVGRSEYVAPPYVHQFTEDIVANDIMKTTAILWSHNVPKDLIMDYVSKLAKYYDSMNWIDMRNNNLGAMMDYAVQTLNQNIANQAAQNSLSYEVAENMIDALVSMDLSGAIKTHIEPLDKLIGGFFPGNFYGLIGFGETYKSVLAQYISYMNAINDVPVIYLNGEMARIQFFERMALQAMGINVRSEMLSGNLRPDNVESFKEQLSTITKNNMFVFSGTNYDKKSILATIDHVYATTGKRAKMVIMDGLSQMNQLGKEEAPANIMNSGICKEISKEANGGEGIVLIALIHCSGAENKLIRNTGTVVRGGSKMVANMDGYFSTSLFVDQSAQNLDNPNDIIFMEKKFCLRFNDKRGGTGVHYNVINVLDRLMLESEGTDYRNYEVKSNTK